MADLDSVNRSYIIASPTGAVRVSSISTITTAAAHGLVPGDTAFIQSVTDTTFNGTWLVDTVPTSTTFTYIQIGMADSSSGVGFLDVVSQGDVYTDTVLMPMLNASYRKVQRKMLESGSYTNTDEVEYLTVPADMKVISDTTDPQLPANFLAPRMLFERLSGGQYREVAQVDSIGAPTQGTLNGVFSWRTEAIYLSGTTGTVDLLLRFYRALDNLYGADSYIMIRGGSDAVAYYTAALASNSRSSPQSGSFQGLADAAMEELLKMQAHSGQYMPRRRMPYGGRSRVGLW